MATVLELGLAGTILTLVILFGMAFRSYASTALSISRMRARVPMFRGGLLCIVAGIVGVAEADAIRWVAGIPETHVLFLLPLAAGYAVIIFGVAVLDVVLWLDPAIGATRPGTRVKY